MKSRDFMAWKLPLASVCERSRPSGPVRIDLA